MTFDEMRFVEEILQQADTPLKAAMESSIDLFVETLKSNSSQKGCRWDDIVFRFEYRAVIVPRLLTHISSKPVACQNFL